LQTILVLTVSAEFLQMKYVHGQTDLTSPQYIYFLREVIEITCKCGQRCCLMMQVNMMKARKLVRFPFFWDVMLHHCIVQHFKQTLGTTNTLMQRHIP